MDIEDIKELIKAAAEGFDLSNFKGDVVGVKVVENEIGNVENGGIGVQKVYNGTELLNTDEGQQATLQHPAANNQERSEERFHFVHPEVEEDEAWRIHVAVKRLVANYRVSDICAYLKEQKQKGKLMLPSNPSQMYAELIRLGMPTGEGFSEKNFSNSYTK